MNPKPTPRQLEFLKFIAGYTMLLRVPPAEADMQKFFQISPPSVHQMILTLEKRGFISRVPGQARSIKVLYPHVGLSGFDPSAEPQRKKIKPDEKLPFTREAHETISYQAMPPNRTFTVPIRFHLRGRGEPLPYQIADE